MNTYGPMEGEPPPPVEFDATGKVLNPGIRETDTSWKDRQYEQQARRERRNQRANERMRNSLAGLFIFITMADWMLHRAVATHPENRPAQTKRQSLVERWLLYRNDVMRASFTFGVRL